jgi:hypothetical protein
MDTATALYSKDVPSSSSSRDLQIFETYIRFSLDDFLLWGMSGLGSDWISGYTALSWAAVKKRKLRAHTLSWWRAFVDR